MRMICRYNQIRDVFLNELERIELCLIG